MGAILHVFLQSLLAIPICYWFNMLSSMKNPWLLFVAANGVLISVVLLVRIYPPVKRTSAAFRDPFLYAFSLFAFTSIVDLLIGLELNGWISNSMLFYFKEGEPYLSTSHGMTINYWDGTGHFLMYLFMLDGIARGQERRNLGLYWFGSVFNSMIVLLCGSVAGKFGSHVKPSYFLNVAYVVVPLSYAYRLLRQQRKVERKPTSKSAYASVWERPLDVLFILYFVAAIIVAFLRGYASLGSPFFINKWYTKNAEPYISDESGFPQMQMLTYMWYFVPYYGAAIYGLLTPGNRWMIDGAILHAGAAIQAQISYIVSAIYDMKQSAVFPSDGINTSWLINSLYRLLDNQQLTPQGNTIFWTINLALLIVPHLFAWRCLTNQSHFAQPKVKQ
ncbi:transmembrane 6 superfamily member 1-like [Oscarella lobularis]|uniref:transmembrane 6 superfamily member 1-like n=1 Tax=Oscarella lobularis TaxID=121494 RepID=UPI0033137EFF